MENKVSRQPPRRTEEQQRVFKQVLPLLIEGIKTTKDIAEEFNLNAATVRAWKKRYISRSTPKPLPYTPTKDIENAVKAAVAQTLKEVAQRQENETNQPITIQAPQQTIATLQQAIVDNALDTQHAVIQGRGEAMGGVSLIAKTLLRTIQRIEIIIDSGVSIKSATYEGEITQAETKLSVQDLKVAAETLKSLQNQLADLYNLPLGAVKPATVRLEPPRSAQHAHVHLHNKSYGQDVQPLQGKPPAIEAVQLVKATPAGEDSMQEWQRRLMEDD